LLIDLSPTLHALGYVAYGLGLCTIPHLSTTMAYLNFYVCKKGINLTYKHHCYNKQCSHHHFAFFFQCLTSFKLHPQSKSQREYLNQNPHKFNSLSHLYSPMQRRQNAQGPKIGKTKCATTKDILRIKIKQFVFSYLTVKDVSFRM
jgi:hypothetical protein